MEEVLSTTPAGLDDVVTVTEVYNVLESSSVSSTTELLTKITESITELVSAIPEITTESSESTTLSNFPSNLHFSPFDYAIFGIMLAMSALIGVYFGFISKRKQNNTEEYLLGGKTMNFFPVAASLIASHVSGITLLGVPAEMYANGTQYWMFVISTVMVAVSLLYVYLPVFYELQLTSSFTYLEKRFDRKVRQAASIIYAISCIVFVPIIVYVPALAFSQVSGINLHIITLVTSIICVFYTTVGGLKAVVWTDTLQFLLMLCAICAVVFLGLKEAGGIGNVWEAADRGGRLIFFNMDPSPFVRTSFWTVSLGLSVVWISNLGVNQGCIQRFLAVPDIKFAKKSVIIFAFGLIFIKSASCLTGLIMYAKYETCDPVTTNKIQKVDQMLPYFVMDVAGKIPGLPGVFIAGIFAAALSSMSSSLNTLAGTIYEDFIRNHYPDASEKRASDVMKVLVVILGILILSLVFIVEHLGQVFRVAISVSGLTAGTLLGLFTIGMVSRTVNTKGAIAGAIGSMSIVSFIMVGAQSLPKHPPLPFRTDGCDYSFNMTSSVLSNSVSQSIDDIPLVFKISFMYYALIGCILLFLIAYPVSWLTGGCEPFDERLLTPLIRSKNWDKTKPTTKTDKKDILYAELDLALDDLKKVSTFDK